MARTSTRDDIQADNPFERDEHGPVSDATSSSAPSAQDELREAIKRCERFLPGHGRIGMRAELERLAQEAGADDEPDNYGKGALIEDFEHEVAGLLGKAAAVFMPSGTMAQQIALRIWADRRGLAAVAFHPTC